MFIERCAGFLLAALFVSGVSAQGKEAAITAKGGVSTEAIDSALLMSEFTVLGIEASYRQASLPRQTSRNEMACVNSKVTPVVRNHFDSAMRSALTLPELQRGNELASAEVFPKVTRYIVDHREQLAAEKGGAAGNLSHYFLVTAASRTNQPVEQQNQIREFITWHSGVHPRISEAVGKQTPQFIRDVAAIFASCRNVP